MKQSIVHITDEATLVKLCKADDPAAQKVLYMRYVEDMLRLSLRYLRDSEDAKEVVMDSFLSVFKNIGTFEGRGEGGLKAWLKKIVINRCLDHLRKRKVSFADESIAERLIDESESAVDTMTAKEILELIHALPDGYRTVFNLYVFEGMNHREIAELLKISEGTSKSQLYRAREILKENITNQQKQLYDTRA